MTTIFHPLSAQDREAMVKLRSGAAPAKGVLERASFDTLMEHTPPAAAVSYEAAKVGEVPGWWCRPADAAKGSAILYLHGGAYIVGSAKAYRNLVGQISVRAGIAAFVVDYGLAPEHPFPVALNEAQAVYKGLAKLGHTSISLAGDSSGGGLALILLSLAVEAARRGAGVSPAGASVLSPWTDLALTGASLESRAEADPFLTKAALASGARQYLAGQDARSPRASALYGELSGLPPVNLHVGEDEILLDDSRRYLDGVAAAGGQAVLHIWAGMPHVFPSNVGTLGAAAIALDDIGAFLKALHVEKRAPSAPQETSLRHSAAKPGGFP